MSEGHITGYQVLFTFGNKLEMTGQTYETMPDAQREAEAQVRAWNDKPGRLVLITAYRIIPQSADW